MDGILFSLFNHTNEAIDKKDYGTLEENISLLKDIFEAILANSKSYNNSKIFNTTVKYINDIIVKMLNVGLYKDSIELMNNILDIYYKRENDACSYIIYDDIFRKLVGVIEEQQSYRQIYQLHIKHLLFNLIKNAGENNGFTIDNSAPQMFGAYYYSILKNKNLNDDEKTKLIDEVLEYFFSYSYSRDIKNNKVKQGVFEHSILRFLKAIVDRMDTQRLEKALLKIGEKSYYLEGSLDVYKIFLLIAIYIYYLAFKEELHDDEKKIYLGLVKGTNFHHIYRMLKSYSHSLWNYYIEAKAVLSRWERMEADAKWMMMKYVVKEYFLFFSIARGNFNLDTINRENNEVLSEAEIFSFLDSYIDENGIKDSLKESYKKFIEAFDFKTNDIDYDLNTLKNQMLSKFKSIKFAELMELNRNIEIIENNISHIKEKIIESVRGIPYIKLFNTLAGKEKSQFEREFRYNISLITYFIADKIDDSYDYLIERLIYELERHFIRNLKEFGFFYKSLGYSHTNKIDELFEAVDCIDNNRNIKIDTLVSGMAPDSHLLYRESQISKDRLKELFTKLTNVEVTKNLIWVGMDTKNIKIDIKELSIEAGRLSATEIQGKLDECKKGDFYNINLTNNIYVLLTEDEAREYFMMNYYMIKFKITYGYYFKEVSPGFIIDIHFE